MKNGATPTLVLGKHGIYDLAGCDPALLVDSQRMRDIVFRTAEIAQITVLGSMDHHFTPQGYSVVLILEESHLSLHTWPEHRYVSVDLFSCSNRTDFLAVRDFLKEQFRAASLHFTLLERGPFEPLQLRVAPANGRLPHTRANGGRE